MSDSERREVQAGVNPDCQDCGGDGLVYRAFETASEPCARCQMWHIDSLQAEVAKLREALAEALDCIHESQDQVMTNKRLLEMRDIQHGRATREQP